LIVASLLDGVFIASAYAAEQLALEAENRTLETHPPGPLAGRDEITEAQAKMMLPRTTGPKLPAGNNEAASFDIKPVWDGRLCRLEYRGVVCLQGMRKAHCRDQILEAFQKAGWPEIIPSPFTDEKQTRDTVEYIKKRLCNGASLRFHAGAGARVIVWEPVESNPGSGS
jgi:hypothetical protein